MDMDAYMRQLGQEAYRFKPPTHAPRAPRAAQAKPQDEGLEKWMIDRLREMVETGRPVVESPDYYDGFANRLKRTSNYQFDRLRDAQLRLQAAGRIVVEEVGPPSRRRRYLCLPYQSFATDGNL